MRPSRWLLLLLFASSAPAISGCSGEANQAQRPPQTESRESVESPGEATAPPDEGASGPDEPTASPDPPQRYSGESPLDDRGDYAVVRTYFATDRDYTEGEEPADRFGAERSRLRFGVCEVSIPRDHRLGELEEPSIWRLEFREDPEDHVVLLEADVMPKAAFLDAVSERLAARDKTALLFVHGFNVTFEDAARRTAQMAYDLAFAGVPMFYSWPSRGELFSYEEDEDAAAEAVATLAELLREFYATAGAERVFLVAHSMGNRVLTRAILSLSAEEAFAGELTEVILTAPDIDAEVFKRDIAPALADAGAPITLYVSSRDLALTESRRRSGAPRLGQRPGVFRGVETIDASSVRSSFIEHSYYGDADSVLSDLFYLIRHGKRAADRFGLARVETDAGAYWEFRPTR